MLRRLKARAGSAAVALFFFSFGVVYLWLLGASVRDTLEAKRWPTVPATITHSSLRQKGSGTRARYIYDIEYRYSFQSRMYEGNTVQIARWSSSNPGYAEGMLSRYPEGLKVRVHINPRNPEQSIVSPSLLHVPWILVPCGLGFLIVPVILLFPHLARRPWRIGRA